MEKKYNIRCIFYYGFHLRTEEEGLRIPKSELWEEGLDWSEQLRLFNQGVGVYQQKNYPKIIIAAYYSEIFQGFPMRFHRGLPSIGYDWDEKIKGYCGKHSIQYRIPQWEIAVL